MLQYTIEGGDHPRRRQDQVMPGSSVSELAGAIHPVRAMCAPW
jgi:hypothetical protein